MATPKYTSEQLQRFWSKVDRSADGDACWIWTAACVTNGYGYIWWDGKQQGAHRVSWQLAHGKIPDDLHVLHNCPDGDNPRCVNPAHLRLGTHQDNMNDIILKRQNRKYYAVQLRDGEIDRICPHCGQSFSTNDERSLYCSKTCMKSAQNARNYQKRKKK